MAHKETLGYHLGTQIDADEGQDRVDSWKDAASLSLQVPESWQHETKGSTAEVPPLKEPPQKKRRSNAATDSGCDVLKTLQAEISQRPCWDVAGTSENLEIQSVEIVKME